MKKEVEQVASNARINLDEDEAEGLADDFEEILEMFETLDDIDTDDVEPSFHPIEVENNSRPDEREDTLEQDQVFQNTDNEEDGFFKGPSA
jgi:aspartyl-tRNA(Asn)/glutamyl-tRNA(Gln) amidotransferase subunit C